ncbi:hypothetical protein [Flavobacterium fluviatile]|uniref:hypothetical protein n=1 Tax=Flavobacterium fluviatile TaxID=1862387 RepID=UPI0013D82AE3|nr:hypothetical protein [Flavobacterium fluviatile]
MKKYIALNLILIIVLILLVSCKSKQPIKEVYKEKEINYDSIFHAKNTEINKAIIDSLTIALGKVQTGRKDCDSVCQIALDNVLARLNIKKQSGDNSYDIRYDAATNTLYINNKIGATANKSKIEYRNVGTIKTIYSHRDIPVEIPLKKWQITLMLIGAASIGYILIKIVNFIRLKTI